MDSTKMVTSIPEGGARAEGGPQGENPETPSEPSRIPLPPLKFRLVDKWDIHFILDSWLKSYRDAKRETPDEDYYPKQQALIGALAARTKLLVACDAETEGFVLGYACTQLVEHPGAPQTPPLFYAHYVYVKRDYRKQGLARALLRESGWDGASPVRCTHLTRVAKDILYAKKLPLIDDDFIIKLPTR